MIDYSKWLTSELQAAAGAIQAEIIRRTPTAVYQPTVTYECCGIWNPCRMPDCVPEKVEPSSMNEQGTS